MALKADTVTQEWSQAIGRRPGLRSSQAAASGKRQSWLQTVEVVCEHSEEDHDSLSSSTHVPGNVSTEVDSSGSSPEKDMWQHSSLPSAVVHPYWDVSIVNTFIAVSRKSEARQRIRSAPGRLDGCGVLGGGRGPCECAECAARRRQAASSPQRQPAAHQSLSGSSSSNTLAVDKQLAAERAPEETPEVVNLEVEKVYSEEVVRWLHFVEGSWIDETQSTYLVEVQSIESRWCQVRSGTGEKLPKRDSRLRVVLSQQGSVLRLQWGPRYTQTLPEVECSEATVAWFQPNGPGSTWRRPSPEDQLQLEAPEATGGVPSSIDGFEPESTSGALADVVEEDEEELEEDVEEDAEEAAEAREEVDQEELEDQEEQEEEQEDGEDVEEWLEAEVEEEEEQEAEEEAEADEILEGCCEESYVAVDDDEAPVEGLDLPNEEAYEVTEQQVSKKASKRARRRRAKAAKATEAATAEEQEVDAEEEAADSSLLPEQPADTVDLVQDSTEVDEMIGGEHGGVESEGEGVLAAAAPDKSSILALAKKASKKARKKKAKAAKSRSSALDLSIAQVASTDITASSTAAGGDEAAEDEGVQDEHQLARAYVAKVIARYCEAHHAHTYEPDAAASSRKQAGWLRQTLHSVSTVATLCFNAAQLVLDDR